MTLRSIVTRTATIALAAAALTAPTASARPADTPPANATEAAAAAAEHHQTRHSTDANGFANRPVIDRSPANTHLATTTQPAADPETNWTTIGFGIAGSLLAIGALAGIAYHARRTGRAHTTA